MRFNAAKFNSFLSNIGQQARWRRSYGCSCFVVSSGSPDPKCKLCGGKGRIWDSPVDVVIGIPRQDAYMKYAQMGIWESGDMLATLPADSPIWDAGQYDRVVLLNSTDVFSQPLTHGAVSEKLLFPVASVSRVFWKDPTTQALVEGGIPTIGADGVPVWTSGEPPSGMAYSITGEKFSEYFVFGHFPSDRNEHSGMKLPKRCQLRKFDLFGRGSNPSS